jgi:hypothetical protein
MPRCQGKAGGVGAVSKRSTSRTLSRIVLPCRARPGAIKAFVSSKSVPKFRHRSRSDPGAASVRAAWTGGVSTGKSAGLSTTAAAASPAGTIITSTTMRRIVTLNHLFTTAAHVRCPTCRARGDRSNMRRQSGSGPPQVLSNASQRLRDRCSFAPVQAGQSARFVRSRGITARQWYLTGENPAENRRCAALAVPGRRHYIISRTSVSRPVTAAAAAIAGDNRWVRPPLP